MREYTPDRWVLLELTQGDKSIRRVLAGWQGGYLDGDSWKINSGVESVEEVGDYFLFHGYSGSVYKCHKLAEGFTNTMSGVFTDLEKQVTDEIKLDIIPLEDICSTL